MNTYVCDWVDKDGMSYCVSFDAEDWQEAERIAKNKGWKLLGQYIEEHDCPADVEAMIEFNITDPTVH